MKRPRSGSGVAAKSDAVAANPKDSATGLASLLVAAKRKQRLANGLLAMQLLVEKFRTAQPGKCKWLSKKTHVLPEIVNIVYTITFQSDAFKTPIDMIRMTQFLPNCKFRPPSFPSATLRIWPITALVYQEGNAVVIKTTSPGEALYQSHVLRQMLEQIPFILKHPGDDKLFIGTLEGRLGFGKGKIDNIVGSGMLYQDGVHLTNLLQAKDSHVDWDPGAFPNAIYRNVLPDGTAFCCNIANTQKIVVMGAKRVRAMFDAYEMTCKVVNEFEDPDVPKDPQLRRRYRLNQLSARNELLLMDASHTELFDPDRVERMSRMTRGDGHGEEEEHDLVGAVSLHMQTVNMLFEKRRQAAPQPPAASASASATHTMRDLLVRAARAEQVSNVRHMLSDDSPAIVSAVWEKDKETGQTLLDEMIVSQLERHKEIMHLLKEYMATHPQK